MLHIQAHTYTQSQIKNTDGGGGGSTVPLQFDCSFHNHVNFLIIFKLIYMETG